MFNFDELKTARDSNTLFEEKREKKSKELYEQALEHIKKFRKNKSNDEITQASEKLYEVIRYNRKHVESFVWLAYIFHILGKEKTALKYIKLAEKIDPAFSQIKKLKDLIVKPVETSENSVVSELSNVLLKNTVPDLKETFKNVVKEKMVSASKSENNNTSYDMESILKKHSGIRVFAHNLVSSYLNITTKDRF